MFLKHGSEGKSVSKNEEVLFDYQPELPVNNFNCSPINEADIRVINRNGNIWLITRTEGELLTGRK